MLWASASALSRFSIRVSARSMKLSVLASVSASVATMRAYCATPVERPEGWWVWYTVTCYEGSARGWQHPESKPLRVPVELGTEIGAVDDDRLVRVAAPTGHCSRRRELLAA